MTEYRYMTSDEPTGYKYLKAESDDELVKQGYSRVLLQFRDEKGAWQWCHVKK